MPAGKLRTRVGFYKRGAAPAGPDYGNTESGFAEQPEFSCLASIQPKLGGETVLAGRLTGTNLVNVTVRQSARTRAVDATWKLKDSETEYAVRSIIDPHEADSERGRWLEILCEKDVAA